MQAKQAKSLAELSELVGGMVEGDPSQQVLSVAPPEQAGADDLVFLLSNDPIECSASAAVMSVDAPAGEYAHRIRVSEPKLAMARILGALFPPDRPDPGVHASAVIHPSARVADSASVGPLAVIGEEAQIGEGAVVESGCVIGRGCLIGEGCWLHARVVLYPETELGRQVTIHSGAVIGAVGFGYLPQASGHLKIPQVGQVVIEDGVEVGANTTIDRATLGRTRIGSGAIIDNLVQIGHNCDIGPMSVIVSQAGVAGSTRLGAGCILAAQSGVGDHVVLEDQVVLGGGSGIYPNTHVAAGSRLLGTPAREAQGVLRQWAMQRKLPQLLHEVKQLGVRLDELTR